MVSSLSWRDGSMGCYIYTTTYRLGGGDDDIFLDLIYSVKIWRDAAD